MKIGDKVVIESLPDYYSSLGRNSSMIHYFNDNKIGIIEFIDQDGHYLVNFDLDNSHYYYKSNLRLYNVSSIDAKKELNILLLGNLIDQGVL